MYISMETRDLILHKALKCFLKDGYDGASISIIAEECGVTKGALYHHFKNKDEIFFECIDLIYRDYDVWLERRIREAADIRSFIKIFFDFQDYYRQSEFVDNKKMHFYRFLFDARDRFPKMQKEQISRYMGYFDRIRVELDRAKADGIVRPEIESGPMAIHIFMLFEGLMLMSAAAGGSFDFTGITDTVFNNVWNLMSK